MRFAGPWVKVAFDETAVALKERLDRFDGIGKFRGRVCNQLGQRQSAQVAAVTCQTAADARDCGHGARGGRLYRHRGRSASL